MTQDTMCGSDGPRDPCVCGNPSHIYDAHDHLVAEAVATRPLREELARLTAENERLRAALTAVVEAARVGNDYYTDSPMEWQMFSAASWGLTYGDADDEYHAAVDGALDTAWGQAAWRELHDGWEGVQLDWFDAPKKGAWVSDRGKHWLAR